jgi:protein SCO1/2
MLIYFGYTNCTDACPLDAQKITDVIDVLDGRCLKVIPVLITVDPQRDTPARLKQFLSSFHPRFVGLTGPVEKVMKVTTAYGASGEGDQVNATADGSYDVLHVAIGYLMGRHGEFLDIVHLKDAPDEIATNIAEAIDKADHHRR